ncbi:MAG: threonylcarbamoyl-AMP synthase [Clostridia bacterium]|nr:threonylcarbamoyl-AMP synthase [Clostridia bacterium]
MTKYINKQEINDDIIFEIANDLKKGKIVVFPTDTVYGIGTNAYDKDACERIYEVKGRPKNKPLSILISDISMLKEMVKNISEVEQKLIDAFWPGPLTIKFKKRESILPSVVSAGDEYVRIRLIKEGLIYKLIKTSGVPIVAPSANLSGSSTGTKIENIINELGGKVDYILDCGDIESDTVSTIVQVEDGQVLIIREGKIKKEELEKVVPVKN